ncbi:hypothetical protein POM88_047933 [Heracleum sosnowskyi]|uniref:ZZ-type domain-containing protein n=1 Tax=Heracleum sosnowskyi TaxID=360622 RepID=A0AAD8M040_9APIA|nr:hypothetical protein POM88_047933 [Heracleum sosnowskyi]
MAFIKHRHPLILNEKYHGAEGDVCYICKEAIPSPLIHSVYTCSGSSLSDSTSSDDDDFVVKTYSAMGKPYPELPLEIKRNDVDCPKLLIHRSCAELPLTITDYPMHQNHTIVLNHEVGNKCSMCDEGTRGKISYNCRDCLNFILCIKCVTSPRVHHPGHIQHQLTVVHHPASFLCYACQDDKHLASASCKCNLCPFWIHMKCALLPSLLKYKFHRHPLLLSYSLSELYLRFRHYCSICHAILSPTQWLYHCANCRFLAHVTCAMSTKDPFKRLRLSSFDEEPCYPAPDESSLHFMQQLSVQRRINDGDEEGSDGLFS